jgi:UDP-N-acetyl-D-mannosaminuronate dehydrogenase
VLSEMDAVVIVTGHDEFKQIALNTFSKTKILIDSRGIIDPVSIKNENIIFRGLGRGKF